MSIVLQYRISKMLKTNRVALVMLVILSMWSTRVCAQTYDFVQESDRAVLASLQFASLPATHEEIVSLTFTEAGDEVLGFGNIYEGDFDQSSGNFLADEGRELFGLDDEMAFAASASDSTPPMSSVPLFAETVGFSVSATPNAGSDTIMIGYINELGRTRVTTYVGDWTLVPEPDCSPWMLYAVVLVVIGKRTRRRFA